MNRDCEAMCQDLSVDVLIIGAGPAGLAAACACQDHDLTYLVMDKCGLAQSFVEYPHTLRFFSPPDEMEIGGVPLPVPGGEKPNREHYLAYLRGVVRGRELNLATWEAVRKCEPTESGSYRVSTEWEPGGVRTRTIMAANIVLATGVWNEPVRLPAAGFNRPNVFSEFIEPTVFFGHRVVVIGGGNSAVGAALSLMEARAKVTVSMRRPPKDYRSGLRPFIKRDLDFAIDEGKIDLRAGTLVTAIGAESVTLQPIEYTGTEELSEGTADDYRNNGSPYELPCRFVFSLLGHRADTTFLREVIGLDLKPDGRPVSNHKTWKTTKPRMYVVGSLADPSIDVILTLRIQAAEVITRIASAG